MGAEGGGFTVTEHFGYSVIVHLKKERKEELVSKIFFVIWDLNWLEEVSEL